MATGRGTDARIAFLVDAKTSSQSYPTSTTTADSQTRTLGADTLLPALSESMSASIQNMPDETLDGGAAVAGSDQVSKRYTGDVACQGIYTPGHLLACALGFERFDYPVPQDDGDIAVPVGDDEAPSSATTTTITDSGKDWTTDADGFNDSAYQPWYIKFYEGPGADKVKKITATNGTTETLTWVGAITQPTTDSRYAIAAAWKHIYEPDDPISTVGWRAGDGWSAGQGMVCGDKMARRGTLCVSSHGSSDSAAPYTKQYTATMVNGFTFSLTPDAVRFVFHLASFSMDKDNEGTQANISTWDWGCDNELISFPDAVFRIGNFSTSADLGDANKVGVSAFTVDYNNNLAIDDQSTTSGLHIEEPARAGVRSVTGSFTVPRYTSDTLRDVFEDATVQMADLTLTGPTIDGTNNNVLKFWFPSLVITNADSPIMGPGLLTATYNFRCELPNGDPGTSDNWANFPNSLLKRDQEFYVGLINEDPYNPFRQQY